MHLFQEVGSEVIEAWKAYGIVDVYLDFRLFYLLFGDFYAFLGCLFGLCKNHIYYGMMNLLGIM